MVQRNEPSSVTDLTTRPKVRDRNRRRVLEAAREMVAAGGLDALSMRALADRAGVSATTLYNLFGTKDGIVHALATDILREVDAGFDHIVDDDPIEQLRARLLLLVEVVIDRAPPSLVSAVLEDPVLTEQINAQWASHTLVEDALRDAMEQGFLVDDLDAALVAEHVRSGLLHQQRMWAAGVIDDTRYRAAAAYAIDIALVAIARGPNRDQLIASLQQLEALMRP